MRKLFTWLFSIFILISGLGFQSASGQAITWDGDNSKPVAGTGNLNVKPADVATKFTVAFDAVPQLSDVGGTLVLYRGSTSEYIATIPISSTASNVTVVGQTIEIMHGQTLETGVVYYIQLLGSAVNNFAGITGTSWSFMLGDYVAPMLKTAANEFTPNKGATSVDAKASSFNLVIPFNENVSKGTAGNVTVYAADGTVVDIVDVTNAAVTISNNEVTVPISDNAIFNEKTAYYVHIDAGAFVDVSPNANKFGGLADNATFTFTTRDYSAPEMSDITISNITTTSATLSVTLSEPGKYFYLKQLASVADPADAAAVKSSGTPVVVSAGATAVTANLTGLNGSNDYEVFVVAENAEATSPDLTADFERREFATSDITNPGFDVTNTGLINNDEKRTTGVYLLFDEEVRGGTGELALRLGSNSSYVTTVPASAVASTKLTTGANAGKWKVAIDFGLTLPSETQYFIVFPETFIEDLNGNTIGSAPISSTSWTFTSSDFVIPVVTFAAADWANGKVSTLASNLFIQFDERVRLANGTNTNANVYKYVSFEQAGRKVEVLDASQVTYDDTNNRVVIDPSSNLTSNTTYTLKLSAGAVEDPNGNVLSTEAVGTVTTGDLDPLTAMYGSSEGETTTMGLLGSSTMKIKFNKEVRLTTTGTPTVTAENIATYISLTKGGTPVANTITYDAATFTVTIDPTPSLVTNAADYALTLRAAFIEDVNGTDLGAADVTTTYTVADYTAPAVALSHSESVENITANLNPTITISDIATYTDLDGNALDATNVRDYIVFKADNASGVNLAYTPTVVGDVITLAPTNALATGSTYYYGIGASVKDASNNVIASTFATFTMIAPAVAPVVTADSYTLEGSAETPIDNKLTNVTPTSDELDLVVNFNSAIRSKDLSAVNTVTLVGGGSTISATITNANISGNMLTVTFATPTNFASETEYTITLPADLVEGSTSYNGTDFAQFAAKTFRFASKDIVRPQISASAPVNASTDVALDAATTLTFDERVELGTGNIQVKIGTDVVETIAVNSTNVSLNDAGTEATITHADFVKYNTAYTVVVPAAAFHDDSSENTLSGDYTYSFTTVKNTQPLVVTYLPSVNQDLVALSTPFTLTFDEEVEKNQTPSSLTRREVHLMKVNGATRGYLNSATDYSLVPGTDMAVASMYIDDATVGVSGSTVTFNFGTALEADADYYILLGPGAFKDRSEGVTDANKPVPGVTAGITTATGWAFTTKDVEAPTVTYTYTQGVDNKVELTSDIVITFSKAIRNIDNSEIVNDDIANLFTLEKMTESGPVVKTAVGTISSNKKIVTILNSSLAALGEFTENSQYEIRINTNAIKSTNVSGAALSGSDTFTTTESEIPTVTIAFANNVNDITDTQATVAFTANDNTTLKKVYYTITAGDATTPAPALDVIKANGQAVSASPANVSNIFTGLTAETGYVVFAVAEDLAGNESTVARLEFTTDDVTKPELVVASLPTSFDNNDKLTVTFNEAVTANTATQVRVINAATMVVEAKLRLNATSNPAQLISDQFTGLAADVTSYYIEIEAGNVMDVPVVAGDTQNTFDGYYGNGWMVTSADATSPSLLSTAPDLTGTSDGSPLLGFNINGTVALTFNENIALVGTLPANAITIEEKVGTNYMPFEILDASSVSISGAVATIDPTRTLSSESQYRVTVKANVFEDLAGNNFASQLQGWIKVQDLTIPTVTLAPANSATNVALGSTITLTFDEEVRWTDGTVVDYQDLQSSVSFSKAGVAAGYTASINAANTVITITPAEALVNDENYSFGVLANKFVDLAGNAVAAKEATFATPVTPSTTSLVSISPNNNTSVNTPATIDQVFTLQFTGEIYTYSTIASENNLPVTSDWLKNCVQVRVAGTLLNVDDLTYAMLSDNTGFTVEPNTAFASDVEVIVSLLADKLQIGQGNNEIVTTTDVITNTYTVEDVRSPILDETVDTGNWEDGRYPVNQRPAFVIAKTDSLQLTFDEKVMAGTGEVEIRTQYGVLAKTIATSDLNFSTNKLSVTLGNLSGLPTNETYYVVIPSGVITDLAGNPYDGMSAMPVADRWEFTLKDDAVPAIISVTPATDNIPVNADLVINFDRPVAQGTGFVALYKSTGEAVELFRTADVTFALSNDDKTVTIDIANLEEATAYRVEVAQGTFVLRADPSIQQVAIPNSTIQWTFTTETNAVPEVETDGLLPAKGATDVEINSDLQLTFDMNVRAGSGNIQVHAQDGTLFASIDVNTPAVTFSGTIVNVELPKLAENTTYYVIVPSTAISNQSVTPEYFAGITVPNTWQFTTLTDTEAPTLTVTDPATPVAATFNVGLVFNEPVTGVESGITASTGEVTVTRINDAEYTVTVVAAENTEVVLTIPSTIMDMAATPNAFAGTTLTYTTGDFTAPTVTADPASGDDMASAFNVTLTFSEAVTGTDAIAVAGATSAITNEGNVYTVAITEAADGATVTITVPGTIADAAGNAITETVFTYTVGDNTAPTLTDKTPATGAALTDNHPVLTMTFSENIVLGTGAIKIVKVGETTAALELDPTATEVVAEVNGAEMTVTYDFATGLDKHTEYYIIVPEGFVKDAANNNFAGVLDNTAWTFTTGDFKTGLDPEQGAEISIYPNPFKSEINISNIENLDRVVITNIVGQVVKQVVNPATSIEASDLRTGVYFITLYSNTGVIKTERIVKR